MAESNRLGFDDVRSAGVTRGWQLHSHDTKGKMASFVRSSQQQRVRTSEERGDNSWWDQRVNVYYSTGTVATALSHPVSGKTQLFRRDMTLRDLCKIFDDPRTHTGVGYYTRDQLARKGSADLETSAVALRQSLADIDTRAKRLGTERAEIAAELANLESEQARRKRAAEETQAQRKRAAEQEAERKEAQTHAAEVGRARTARGRTAEVMMERGEEFFETFDCTTTCIALGPRGCYIGLREDGASYWSSGLPRGLYNQLNGRDPKLPSAHYVAMGADGDWFVQYGDKSFRSMGLPEEQVSYLSDNYLRPRVGLVEQVVVAGAFWYVRFADGRHNFCLPMGLADLLNGRDTNRDPNVGRVEWLSVVNDDEYDEPAWYVRFGDGTSQWSGLDDRLSSLLRGPNIGDVIVGPEGQWVCRYSPR
jgi:hypothetical protein